MTELTRWKFLWRSRMRPVLLILMCATLLVGITSAITLYFDECKLVWDNKWCNTVYLNIPCPYHWYARGPTWDPSGFATWNDDGIMLDNDGNYKAVATGTITFSDGHVDEWGWGTSNDPYTFTKATCHSKTCIGIINGTFYYNGVNKGILNRTTLYTQKQPTWWLFSVPNSFI